MKVGDKFYIHVLDQTLAYQVDQIMPMVDKNDTETLTSAMQNVEGQDYVTLFTCTPYGINSHRYLVRGVRTEYHGEDDEKVSDETMLQSIQEYYMLYALLVVAILLLCFTTFKMVKRRHNSHPRREKNEKNEGK